MFDFCTRRALIVLKLVVNLHKITVHVWLKKGIIFIIQCSFIKLSLCQYASSQPLYWTVGHDMTTQPRHCAHCQWRLIGPAVRAFSLLSVCLILLRILEGKCSYLNYPLPQGWLRFWRSAISLFLSLCPSTFLLLNFFSSSLKILPSLFLSLAVSNSVFHPAVKQILQKCWKFHENIPVSTNWKEVNKSSFWVSN